MDEFLVVPACRQVVVEDGLAQRIIAGAVPADGGLPDDFHRLLDRIGEAVADPVAARDAHVEPVLEDAGIVSAHAETGRMQETEKQAEFGVLVLFQHPPEVELDVGELHQLAGVPKQAEGLSVCNDPIDVLRVVEVLQHRGVRGFALTVALGPEVKGAFVQGVYGRIARLVSDDDDR